MDSEDEKWLSQFNESRKKKGLSLLSEDEFEIMIDRLEKTSFEQVIFSFFSFFILLKTNKK